MESKRKSKLIWWLVSIAMVLALAAVLAMPALRGSIGAADGAAFTLTVTTDGTDILFSDTVTADKDESLIDTMERCITEDGGVVYENGEYGAFIASICGEEQDSTSGRYWTYTVNGEYAAVGASEYYPNEGDTVVFDLSAVQW